MVKREVKNEKSKGFTLIEMILVLAALVTFLTLVFTIYKNRIEPSRWSSDKFRVFQSIVVALESAKSANGGAYPAATNVDLGSSSVPEDPKAKLVWYAVTGGSPSLDVAGWAYSCSESNLDITVNITDKPSEAAAGVFIESVKNNLGFTVNGTVSDPTVTFSRTNVLCR